MRFAVVNVLLFAARSASASELSTYDAPEGCPDRVAFVAAVEERGGSVAALDAHRVEVVVRASEDGYVGALTLHDGVDASEPCVVRDASCANVVEALALATTVALRAGPSEPAAPTPSPKAPAAPRVDAQQGPEPGTVTSVDWVKVWAGIGSPIGVAPRFDLTWDSTDMVTGPDGRAPLLRIFRARFGFVGPITTSSPRSTATTYGLNVGIGRRRRLFSTGPVTAAIAAELAALVVLTRGPLDGFCSAPTCPPRADTNAGDTWSLAPSLGSALEIDVLLGRRFSLSARGGADLVGPMRVRDLAGDDLFTSGGLHLFAQLVSRRPSDDLTKRRAFPDHGGLVLPSPSPWHLDRSERLRGRPRLARPRHRRPRARSRSCSGRTTRRSGVCSVVSVSPPSSSTTRPRQRSRR